MKTELRQLFLSMKQSNEEILIYVEHNYVFEQAFSNQQ